jgi:GH15 family glucan-1,4-alpha-glucosidase
VHALFGLGYEDDTKAFIDWLLHATRLTRPELRVLYDVYGEQPSDEAVLKHLAGHAASRPVRIGNAANEQTQLDIYGEVIEAISHFIGKGKSPDRETQKMLRQCGEYACARWRDYDNGMWEYRDELRPYTHSRLMCWVALDRLIKMHERGQLSGIAVERFETERARVRAEIEQYSWNSNLQAYTQMCGGDTLDASALLLAYHGFADADSKRMQQTHERVRRMLSPRPGLLYRDERSKNRHEGAFALCSFWEADFLARSGNRSEARETFEAALEYANDVDLFAEEIDPESGAALGNFPQAFTHLGVINAALSLCDNQKAPYKFVS